ncbi:hypothetical protein BDQ17DRAFT_1334042 [Cyathus striatus]|nr:hypothetical protein BDQ17DRAFT_1334042 [Cyathus striatus]
MSNMNALPWAAFLILFKQGAGVEQPSRSSRRCWPSVPSRSTKAAGQDETCRLLVQALPQIPAIHIILFHQGYMAGHNQSSRPAFYSHSSGTRTIAPNEPAPGQAEVAQGALLNPQAWPGLGASGPPPRQSLSPAPSLITSSTPMCIASAISLPGTSAAFFSGNPAQPSEVGALVRII